MVRRWLTLLSSKASLIRKFVSLLFREYSLFSSEQGIAVGVLTRHLKCLRLPPAAKLFGLSESGMIACRFEKFLVYCPETGKPNRWRLSQRLARQSAPKTGGETGETVGK